MPNGNLETVTAVQAAAQYSYLKKELCTVRRALRGRNAHVYIWLQRAGEAFSGPGDVAFE